MVNIIILWLISSFAFHAGIVNLLILLVLLEAAVHELVFMDLLWSPFTRMVLIAIVASLILNKIIARLLPAFMKKLEPLVGLSAFILVILIQMTMVFGK